MFGRKPKLQKYQVKEGDFWSLSAIYNSKGAGRSLINDWLGEPATIEFLGVWEIMFNPNFDLIGFEKCRTRNQPLPIAPEHWIKSTGAIGLKVQSGQDDPEIFAHKDIVYEFGSWVSPQFKLYLIKEFYRLKTNEESLNEIDWNFNQQLHSDKRGPHKMMTADYQHLQHDIEFGNYNVIDLEEADLLNVALFGWTEKMWEKHNPKLSDIGKAMRDTASINELAVLSNLERINSELIKRNIDKSTRFNNLRTLAMAQLDALDKYDLANLIKPMTIESQQIDKVKKEPSKTNLTFGDAIKTISQAGKPKSK